MPYRKQSPTATRPILAMNTNTNENISVQVNGAKKDLSAAADATSQPQLPTATAVTNELSSWIHSIFIVTFDIEFGQAIEAVYPKFDEVNLSERERNNICYSSFPDSNSSIIGATQFHFRIRSSTKFAHELKQVYLNFNKTVPQALQIDEQFLYGYVHFLQKKDATLKRGYFQKSLVILTPLPFVELFKFIVGIVGFNYFENEYLLNLETFYHQTCYWPPLNPDTVLDLTIQGANVAFYIPNKYDKLNNLQQSNLTSSSLTHKIKSASNQFQNQRRNLPIFSVSNNLKELHHQQNLGQYTTTTVHGSPLVLDNPHYRYQNILTAFDLDLHKCFSSVIPDLQLLWEMILTCEPFIVIASTPDVCANFVQALTSLIYPFKYYADFRPFFTIHDQEFKEYIGLRNATPNALLGVTNPFFTKSLEHWPNVVHLSCMKGCKSSDQLSSFLDPQIQNHHQQLQAPSTKLTFAEKLRFASETQRVGLSTKLKPFLQKDRNFLSTVLRSDKIHGSNRPNNVQTALIRRWLIVLTQSFFMPLERYLVQLMPLHNKISPFKAPPELPSFDFNAFFASLDTSGPQLTTNIKGDWVGLYKKFFASPNFSGWYMYRKTEIDNKLLVLHMESFLDADIPQVIGSKGEVEVVDMIIFLKNRLNKSADVPAENLAQFRQKVSQLIYTLPEDMRFLFLKDDNEQNQE